jgi:pyrroloquinoline quinone biosynthesis protein B
MRYVCLFCVLCVLACKPGVKNSPAGQSETRVNDTAIKGVSLVVLGTVQDAGSPHIACRKVCCRDLFTKPDPSRKVVSLGVIDPQNRKNYLFEASPDLPLQMKLLRQYSAFAEKETPDGIFLTHAHIGHYSGLMYLGREAMNADSVAVYAMPKMRIFLEHNGPWNQLLSLGNIYLSALNRDSPIQLTSQLKVTPFTVPHRDEYSETVGYIIKGPHKKVLFIPDIDKWDKWEKDIVKAIAEVDYAFIDATFYDSEEINNRDISEIPHPFVIETMQKLAGLPATEKAKIHFIHFNHTNPLLNPETPQTKTVQQKGFNIARMHMVFEL